jgi:hypothetical protein
MAGTSLQSIATHRYFTWEECRKMLKKRIFPAIAVLSLSLVSLPAASHAAPLAGLPFSGADVVMKLADWLDLLPGSALRAKAPRVPYSRRGTKNGCAIDPNGATLCQPGSGSGATTSAAPDGSGE